MDPLFEKLRQNTRGKWEPLTADERLRLVRWLARAPFARESRPLREWARLTPSRFIGQPHPSDPSVILDLDTPLRSDEWHLLKHREDGGWLPGTSVAEYVADAQSAVTRPDARIVLGAEHLPARRTEATRLAVVAPVADSVAPQSRVVGGAGGSMVVIYDPDRRCICSAYVDRGGRMIARLHAKWRNARDL